MDNSNYIPYYSYQGTTHVFYFSQPGDYNYYSRHNILHVAHPVIPTQYNWQSHFNPSQQNLTCSTPNCHSTTGFPSTIYSPIEIPRGSYGHQNHQQTSPIIAGARHTISQFSPTPSGDKINTSDGNVSKTFDSSATSAFDIPELSDYSMLESQSSSSASNISASAPAFTNKAVIFNPYASTNVSNSSPANNSVISNTSSTDVNTSVLSISSNGSTSSSSAISEKYTVS